MLKWVSLDFDQKFHPGQKPSLKDQNQYITNQFFQQKVPNHLQHVIIYKVQQFEQ